ncbi:MAG: ATP-dependent protease [Acidimicrobiaceae bacterium]|nr:ATP-dependent protease [Acidimicrobiaceae bacterium]MYG99778.1 ATP-dependent protease [Acidimicrobiaceae bacterium]MYL05156.1 ATP-dependent protease [Acidimicrobiaceae bacterium]
MATPMFALQSVLLPGSPLPLQVFEPRYLTMLETVLEGDQQMGVVLIERGREVGGSDVRCDVATMARVVEARRVSDGRLLVMAVGHRRIRVRRWLVDDPHPWAETEDWPDEPETAVRADPESIDELAGLVTEARGLALRLQIGHPAHAEAEAPGPVELGRNLSLASYRAAALAPLGPFDRFKVLSTPTATERLTVTRRLVADATELLRARIELGSG